MTISYGSQEFADLSFGATDVTVAVGQSLVWTDIYDDFNRADTTALTVPWVCDTPASIWHIGITGYACRLSVPDGLTSNSAVTDMYRHGTLCAGDDGYLEFQITNKGDPDYHTWVWARYINDGTATAGVGVDLVSSVAYIAARIAGTNVIQTIGVAFSAGDVLRLTRAGNVHSLYLNGAQTTSWNDGGATASKGTGYRSIGIHMQGAKDLNGPRRFSPSLNYIDAK